MWQLAGVKATTPVGKATTPADKARTPMADKVASTPTGKAPTPTGKALTPTVKPGLRGKAALAKFLRIDPKGRISKKDKDNYDGWIAWMRTQAMPDQLTIKDFEMEEKRMHKVRIKLIYCCCCGCSAQRCGHGIYV